MSQTISVSSLLAQLKNAEDESERFHDPLKQGELDRSGVRYLYEQVLTPLLEYHSVNTAELDMERFDKEDIKYIYDYYYNNLTDNSREFLKLRQIYSQCKATKPQRSPVVYL